jgi:hypothetical protein
MEFVRQVSHADLRVRVPESWKKSYVNIVVLRWNTHTVPAGLTVPAETASVFVSGLSPLTGPYTRAPATIQIG